MRKLTLTIEMGNDAMQDGRDLAACLINEAGRMEDGYTSGHITDANGNQVGYWEVRDDGLPEPRARERGQGGQAPGRGTLPR